MGFKEDMVTFQAKFRDLEREYEQWFSGDLRTPPWNTQKICERIVNQYSRNPSGNLSEQAIFSEILISISFSFSFFREVTVTWTFSFVV